MEWVPSQSLNWNNVTMRSSQKTFSRSFHFKTGQFFTAEKCGVWVKTAFTCRFLNKVSKTSSQGFSNIQCPVGYRVLNLWCLLEKQGSVQISSFQPLLLLQMLKGKFQAHLPSPLLSFTHFGGFFTSVKQGLSIFSLLLSYLRNNISTLWGRWRKE